MCPYPKKVKKPLVKTTKAGEDFIMLTEVTNRMLMLICHRSIYNENEYISKYYLADIKETVSRDFRFHFFLHTTSPGPNRLVQKRLRIFFEYLWSYLYS